MSPRWNLQPLPAVVKLWIVHRSTKELSVPEITSFDLKHVLLLAKLVTTWAGWASETILCKAQSTQKKAFEIDFRSFKLETWYRQIQFPVWSYAWGGAFAFIAMSTAEDTGGLIENLQWPTIAWSYSIETEQEKKTQKRLWKSLQSVELEFPLVPRYKIEMCSPFVRMKIIKSSEFAAFFGVAVRSKQFLLWKSINAGFKPRDD